MRTNRKSLWLAGAALMIILLTASGCNGNGNEPVAPAEEDVCNGNVVTVSQTVTRVTPSPDEDYAAGSTHTWDAPPYGVEVTGNGEARLNVYYGSSFIAKYSAYAAGVKNHAQFSVTKWNGANEVSLAVGNYLIEDNDADDVCEVNVDAAGVGISSIGTKYFVTVRPETDEVTVGVLDGVVEVTSRGKTVTLDAKIPSQQMIVVTRGEFSDFYPIPNPDALLEEVMTGKDISIPEPPPPPPPPPSVDYLTVWADDHLVPILEEIKAQFEMDTGIKVQIVAMPVFDIMEKYLAAWQAGEAPDLVTIQHQQIYELAANGYVLPLGMNIDPGELIPGTIQAFSYKGELYGVPYAYDNVALISNPEYAPEIPQTWSELRNYAEEISAGREFFTSLMIPCDGYYFYPLQSAFGGYVFGTYPDGTFNSQDLGIASEGSLAAASWYEEMVYTQPIFDGDQDYALELFQGRNAAMIVTGPWQLQHLREMGVPFQVHSFPREVQESQPFLGVYGFIVSRSSPAPEAALNLLWNYLNTYDAVRAYSNALGLPPARWDVLENIEDADLRAFGFAGVNGTPIPYIPEMEAVWVPWTDAIYYIVTQEMSGYDAFMYANEVILKEIGQ